MSEPVVLSLGGSILVPGTVNTRFLRAFVPVVRQLAKNRRVAIVVGGGAPARAFIAAARSVGVRRGSDLHWIGIRQTLVNAELVRAALGIKTSVITSYSSRSTIRGRVVVAAGRRPGASTDYCAVVLAGILRARNIFNITNVDGVHSADPHRFRTAKFLSHLSWSAYRAMFGNIHVSGAHSPFDPVASKAAAAAGMRVFVLPARLKNLVRAIEGRPFHGTVIGMP